MRDFIVIIIRNLTLGSANKAWVHQCFRTLVTYFLSEQGWITSSQHSNLSFLYVNFDFTQLRTCYLFLSQFQSLALAHSSFKIIIKLELIRCETRCCHFCKQNESEVPRLRWHLSCCACAAKYENTVWPCPIRTFHFVQYVHNLKSYYVIDWPTYRLIILPPMFKKTFDSNF